MGGFFRYLWGFYGVGGRDFGMGKAFEGVADSNWNVDFGEPFEWSDHAFGSGRLKISPDGFYVFCTVKGGIRYTETGL